MGRLRPEERRAVTGPASGRVQADPQPHPTCRGRPRSRPGTLLLDAHCGAGRANGADWGASPPRAQKMSLVRAAALGPGRSLFLGVCVPFPGRPPLPRSPPWSRTARPRSPEPGQRVPKLHRPRPPWLRGAGHSPLLLSSCTVRRPSRVGSPKRQVLAGASVSIRGHRPAKAREWVSVCLWAVGAEGGSKSWQQGLAGLTAEWPAPWPAR